MKRNIIIIVLLAVAVVAVVALKKSKEEPTTMGHPDDRTLLAPESTPMSEATTTREPLPKLLDLGAGKCIPCKAMAPILEEMKATFSGQLDVEFIDVWESEGAGEKYGIRMIPTQIFFDAAGKELFRHEGFYARADMLAKWKSLGYTFAEKE